MILEEGNNNFNGGQIEHIEIEFKLIWYVFHSRMSKNKLRTMIFFQYHNKICTSFCLKFVKILECFTNNEQISFNFDFLHLESYFFNFSIDFEEEIERFEDFLLKLNQYNSLQIKKNRKFHEDNLFHIVSNVLFITDGIQVYK